MLIRYQLPFPPSVNHLFNPIGNRRMIKSREYRSWFIHAGNAIIEQGRKAMKGEVVVSIALVAPDKRRRDASNLIKAVEDLLVNMRVIEGDDNRYVQKISAQWVDDGEPCTVLVQQYERGLAA